MQPVSAEDGKHFNPGSDNYKVRWPQLWALDEKKEHHEDLSLKNTVIGMVREYVGDLSGWLFCLLTIGIGITK